MTERFKRRVRRVPENVWVRALEGGWMALDQVKASHIPVGGKAIEVTFERRRVGGKLAREAVLREVVRDKKTGCEFLNMLPFRRTGGGNGARRLLGHTAPLYVPRDSTRS